MSDTCDVPQNPEAVVGTWVEAAIGLSFSDSLEREVYQSCVHGEDFVQRFDYF